MPRSFSYGSLRQPAVQMAIFERGLSGDATSCWRFTSILRRRNEGAFMAKTPGKTVRVKIRRDGPMCFIPVPFDPRAEFGKLRAPVKVTLNGYSYRSTIFSMRGHVRIPLRKSNRDAAGLEGNETLTVRIALDEAKRVVKVPADLARALQAVLGARERWDALGFTARREFVEGITGAKQAQTRARRVARALAAVSGNS